MDFQNLLIIYKKQTLTWGYNRIVEMAFQILDLVRVIH